MRFFLLFAYVTAFAWLFQAEAQQNINSLTTKDIKVNGSLEVNSTSLASKPCPVMTESQRNAIASPQAGRCVYNSNTNQLNIYNGTIWKSAGGGISNWETAFNYAINDVVIESNKIYQCNTAHTSTVFASDIANWTQIANNVSDASGVLPMANGGTDKALTPVLGGLVYTDDLSMEVLGAGTDGQVLKSNGAAAPSWEDASNKVQGQAQTEVDFTKLEFPNQNVTETATGAQLVYDSGLIFDGGFESATAFQGHTIVNGGAYFAVVTTAADVLDGKKTARVTCFSATPGTDDCEIEQTVSLGTTRLLGFPMLLSVRVDTPADQPLTFCAKIDGVKKDCVTGYKGYLTIPTQAGSSSVGYTLTKTSTPTPLNSFFDSIKVEITETTVMEPNTQVIDYYGSFYGSNINVATIASSYTEVTNSSLTLENYIGAAQISCSGTNPSTGATCSAGNESLGITKDFNSGTHEVCFSFSANVGANALDTLSTFQVVETANSSQTILQEGKEKIEVGGNGSNAADTEIYAVKICGILNFSSAGTKTVRLMYEKQYSTALVLTADRAAARGQRDIAVIVKKIPVSNQTYSDRCRDQINCETQPSFSRDTSNVISGVFPASTSFAPTCTGTTTVTCNITSGNFAVAPKCWARRDSAGIAGFTFEPSSISTTSVVIPVVDAAANPINSSIRVYCQRQGQDYINAKVNQIVGSFKDYVRTPNTATGKVGFCSAKISATGVISDQLGGCFASCTNATTPVCTFTSNYWRSGSIPNCWAQGTSSNGNNVTAIQDTSFISTTSYGVPFVQLSTGTFDAGARKYFCHGEIQ